MENEIVSWSVYLQTSLLKLSWINQYFCVANLSGRGYIIYSTDFKREHKVGGTQILPLQKRGELALRAKRHFKF